MITGKTPMPMRFRKLRIAWSVAWGVLCMMLIALWGWSYYDAGRLVLLLPATSGDGHLLLRGGN